jgi:hypothetical protein
MLDFLVTGTCFCGHCDNDVKLLATYADPAKAVLAAMIASKDGALMGKFLAIEIPIDVRIRYMQDSEPENCQIIAHYIDGVFSAVRS